MVPYVTSYLRAAKNAMRWKSKLAQLREAFSDAYAGDDHVVVLRAEGPVFCAGMDLRGRQAREMMRRNSNHCSGQSTYPLPVIAIVQGDAIARGNELALHCDFVIASENAKFGMPLAKIGLAPTWFLAKKLLEVAGPVGARTMLLLGDPLSARRMAEMGLITAWRQ